MKIKLLYLSVLFISIIFIFYNECNCNYIEKFNIGCDSDDESSDEELTRGSKRTKSTDESTDDLRTRMEDFEKVNKYEREDLLKYLKHYLDIYLIGKQKLPEERKKIYDKLKNISNNELAILIIQLKYKKIYEKILNDKLKKFL